MATAQERAASRPESSWTSSSGRVRILPVLRPVFDALDGAGVRYCHWKSNRNLASALRGDTDLDLLVHRGDAACFRSIVERAGFRPARNSGYPSIANYYGLDDASGKLVDLHIYYRTITGATIKNYHLPVESMLLEGARRTEHGVYRPARSAELVLFVIRKTLDYAVLSEALRPRQWKRNAEELGWLSEGVGEEEVAALLREHLPTIDFAFFQQLRDSIRSDTSRVRRFLLGRALASRLRPHLRYRAPLAMVLRTRHLCTRVWHALRRGRLPILHALRAVMLGYERKRLLVRAHRRAAGGTIVIADRYPTRQPGVPEGPSLHFLLEDARLLYRWLARVEERLYRSIPPPDLILSLNVPLEVAIQRNLTRAKPGGPEPTGYRRRRDPQCSK